MTPKKKQRKEHPENTSESISNDKGCAGDLFDKICAVEETPSLETETKIDAAYTPVNLSFKAYRRIVGYAIRHANDNLNRSKWREVYGILIGCIENDNLVIVKDAIPICVGGRAGVEFEPIHYVDSAQIDESVFKRSIEDDKDDFAIGWWHTHPGFSFFFSDVDKTTHLGYQGTNPYGIGLVFDHCEKKSNSLGIAALRLKNPSRGILSEHRIVELRYELDVKKMNQKVNKVVDKINKNMEGIEKDLNYIQNSLIKKGLNQLQKNYGLPLVPKLDKALIDDNELDETDINKLYVWDLEAIERSYEIPKFREMTETKIKEYQEILSNFKENNQLDEYNSQSKIFREKLKKILSKPIELYEKLMDEFTMRIETINPYYDYLDTNERKIVEYFEEKISEYYEILEVLNKKAELSLNA